MSDIIKGRHAPGIYRDIIHPELEQKLYLQSDAELEQERQDAKFLEECFNDIKRIVIGDMSLSWSPMANVLTQEAVQRLKSYDVFKYIGDPRWGASNQGIAFEYDLARIIGEIIFSKSNQTALEKSINQLMEKALVGTKNTESSVRFSEDQFKFIVKNSNKDISASFKRAVDAHSNEPYYTLVDRAGVVDLKIAGSFDQATLSYDFVPNETFQRLLNILSTATFSAKNYLIESVMHGINLGNATQERFLTTALSSLGIFDSADIAAIYGKTKNYTPGKSGYETVMEHLQHLRFAYELMGVGQSTGEAKFLIVNQRYMSGTTMYLFKQLFQRDFFMDTKRGEIKVFSNRWLIQQVYNNGINKITNKKGNLLFINNL